MQAGSMLYTQHTIKWEQKGLLSNPLTTNHFHEIPLQRNYLIHISQYRNPNPLFHAQPWLHQELLTVFGRTTTKLLPPWQWMTWTESMVYYVMDNGLPARWWSLLLFAKQYQTFPKNRCFPSTVERMGCWVFIIASEIPKVWQCKQSFSSE